MDIILELIIGSTYLRNKSTLRGLDDESGFVELSKVREEPYSIKFNIPMISEGSDDEPTSP